MQSPHHYRSGFPRFERTEPAFELTIQERHSVPTIMPAPADGALIPSCQPIGPVTPSGREVTSQVLPEANEPQRGRARGPGRVVWATLGVLSAGGAVALYLAVSQDTPGHFSVSSALSSSAKVQEDQRNVVQTGSLAVSSPGHWVEPPRENEIYAPMILAPVAFVGGTDDNAELMVRAGNVSSEFFATRSKTTVRIVSDGHRPSGVGDNISKITTGEETGDTVHHQPSDPHHPSDVSSQSVQEHDRDPLAAKGDHLLGLGDVASARLVYRLAALDGSATAATSMGSTYDPAYLKNVGLPGTRPNLAEAIKWYKKAITMGGASAKVRLRELTATLENAPAPGDSNAK